VSRREWGRLQKGFVAGYFDWKKKTVKTVTFFLANSKKMATT